MSSTSAERGQVVGDRYRLEAILGEGGMAVVWRAVHTETDRTVALKLVRAELVRDERIREMFVKEARVAARIGRNDHIVDVLDAGVDATLKVPFIAMELLTGGGIDTKISDGPIDRALVATLVEQLADALEQAHAAGVVHRDLKPQNLFLTQDRKGRPLLKVVDFGIAKLAEAQIQKAATHVGTPAYAAPEQLGDSWRSIGKNRGKNIAAQVSPGTDVWAMGLIVYEMLTGSPPGWFWGAQTLAELPVKIVLEPLPAAAARADPALVPPNFDAWLAKCLDLDATQRWPSARAAVDALLPLLGGLRVSEPSISDANVAAVAASANASPPQPVQQPQAMQARQPAPQQPQAMHAAQQPAVQPQPSAQPSPPLVGAPVPMHGAAPPAMSPPMMAMAPTGPPQHLPPPGFRPPPGPPPGTGMAPAWPTAPAGGFVDPRLQAWITHRRAELRAGGDVRALQAYPVVYLPRVEHVSREVRLTLPNAVITFADAVASDAMRKAIGEDRMLLAIVQAPRLMHRVAIRSKRSSGGLVDGMSRGLKALDALVSSPAGVASVLGDPNFEMQFEIWAPNPMEARAALPIPLRQLLMMASFHGIIERFPGVILMTSFSAPRFDPTDLDRMLDAVQRVLGSV